MASKVWAATTRAAEQDTFVMALAASGTTEAAFAALSRSWLRSNAGLVARGSVILWSPEALNPEVRDWPRQLAEGESEPWDADTLVETLVGEGHPEAAAQAYLQDWNAALKDAILERH